jgi:hypothetical protein
VIVRTKQAWEVLSCPCGSQAHIDATLTKVFERTACKLNNIKTIPQQHVALTLLRVCAAFGPTVFFARCVGPSPAFAVHDANVRDAFSHIVSHVPNDAWAQAELPIRVGGLGLPVAATPLHSQL